MEALVGWLNRWGSERELWEVRMWCWFREMMVRGRIMWGAIYHDTTLEPNTCGLETCHRSIDGES